ncbi:MAG: hypothetical protein B7Y25_03710 [Alphaproteobacteria bacterium 16-39-46]|nr:MAG: hypothetical protein B7Y25_03710 [Alphaproteobacteria bacterium 16-39-46]OZA43158.1 MAG: hypothetical protein B7X84_03935 [Alphaproteobacteria bacterium 17-39-52]HQS84006.1 ABC transporter transmembrane domain-containing protein [Alphaproteobacteria bacterium]HQS93886.1 ABC transporter transmembrane domain-containing protein [Alphaproteobacteria bacterium]
MFREPNYAETVTTSTASKSHSLGILKLLITYLSPYKWVVFKSVIAILVASLAVLGLGQGIRVFIDQGFGTEGFTSLYEALGLMVFLIIVLSIASFCRVYYLAWLGERVVADIRFKTFNHLLSLSPSFFEERGVGDLMSRLLTDTTLIQIIIGTSVAIALRNAFLLIGGLLLLFITSPKLTFILGIMLPIVLVPIIFYGKRVKALSQGSQERIGKLGVFSEEIFEAVQTVQSFVRENYESQNFKDLIESYFEKAILQVKARSFLTMMVMMLIFGCLCCVVWMGGLDVKAGEFSAGDLTSFLFYALLVGGAAGAISEITGDLQRAAGALSRILELLNTRSNLEELKNPERLISLESPLSQEEDKIVPFFSFQEVSFAYPSRLEDVVIHEFTLDIYRGEHIAFVGPSGAGKSTLFALILRFFDPLSGNLFFQGVNLKHLSLSELRQNISWVSQETFLFTETVQENIRFGNLEATEAEIEEALKTAQAFEFVERLPGKMNASIGEKGGSLSGGQRQRLALARAFLKDAPLLLLDEATSALDSLNERMIQKAMENTMKGRTSIIIAHRLATVKKADRIVVMNQEGRIAGVGDHASLMASNPLYKNLVELELL